MLGDPVDLERHRRDVVIHGCRVAYVDVGSGPRTCLLLHGLAGSWDFWMHNIAPLAETRRVIAVDIPGFGRSEKPKTQNIDALMLMLRRFLDELLIDKVDVIGHSMGSLIACELAARHPEVVRSVILTGGPVTSVIKLFTQPFKTLRQNPEVASFVIEAITAGLPLTERTRRLIVKRPWARRIALRTFMPHPERLSADEVLAMLRGAGAPGVLPTLRQCFGYDFHPALAGVRAPTLVIAGERDTIAPPSDAHAFAKSNAAVQRVEVVPDTGHMAMLEQPQIFNRLVIDFLRAGQTS